MLLRAAADDIVKVLLNLAVDDEDDLLKACLQRVIERIVHDDFAVAANGVDLLEPAVAAAHSCCHDNESRFLHIQSPLKTLESYLGNRFSFAIVIHSTDFQNAFRKRR
ncbi:hypothetical protein SDC9_127025 [bioreactor metagenome]|uniref:Uncharacterized protein n=1 Tax=bioreactor metagenome TaxID=1076179 RepID=A0A645CTF2_9ZZZZ